MKIAFFDSGVGGLSVLYEAVKMIPKADYLYYADTDNVPYGTKPKEIVKKMVFDAVEFLASKNIDALVVACNTATSIAIKDLREFYNFPVIGMEPAVKPALQNCSDKRVMVFATPLTLREEKFNELVSRIDQENLVDSLPMPGLVRFAEEFNFDESVIKEYIKNEMKKFNIKDYGTVVLGCTHFVFYKKIIADIFNQADIIDGNEGTVRHLKSTLISAGTDINSGRGTITLYNSGREDSSGKYLAYFDILQKLE